MASLTSAIFYTLIFLSIYAQVFLLITFLENRKKITIRNHKIKLSQYPAVTIVVPSWNEEKTIYKTIRSLLALRYPQDKLKLFLVDDGSTDSTWNIISKFAKHKNVKVFRKENGGKYTALNLGLQNLETEFFGCLDADSVVDTEALVRIMSYFEADKEMMAVVPSVTVHNSKSFIQTVQKAEYNMGVFSKKMLGFLGAIHVTPGPFTIFRRKVFDDLGLYRHGHNTEDMEIAYRMQKHDYKIDHCNDAYVYTNTPSTIHKLYKQRLRWIYGFINNTFDYRNVIFKRKYGNFAFFTLPAGIISILSVCYVFGRTAYSIGDFIYSKIVAFDTVGFQFSTRSFDIDLFFLNTQFYALLSVATYLSVFFAIMFGKRMVENKWTISPEMFYFFPVFGLIAPFWLLRAIWNTIINKTPSWK